MNDAVEQLAQARYIEVALRKLLAQREAELHVTPEWQQWEAETGDFRVAKANVLSAEAEVREQALAIHAETSERTPHPAVKIKMYTILIYEFADAFDYAREHLPQALKLNRRRFDKAAKVLELDFIDIEQEPRATIARDLSKYLLPVEKGDE